MPELLLPMQVCPFCTKILPLRLPGPPIPPPLTVPLALAVLQPPLALVPPMGAPHAFSRAGISESGTCSLIHLDCGSRGAVLALEKML
ncbi:hypothetical protein BTVI_95201 [Pitangus sulphuratus]|nr:hypothetical protein BTVI_95201 [Pitangus sulphuratus]